jgi:hypothetical protein
MNADEWRARVALMLPYLEHREPLVAEIAYGELAAAPYAALLAAKPRLAAPAIRRWLADPKLTARQPLYLLLIKEKLCLTSTNQGQEGLPHQLRYRTWCVPMASRAIRQDGLLTNSETTGQS